MRRAEQRSLAARAEPDVEPVLRPRDAVIHVVCCDADGPVAQLEGRARVLHLHGELEALLCATAPKFKGSAGAGAVDDLPAPVLVVELRRPKRGQCPEASHCRAVAADARDDVRFGEERAVDLESTFAEREDRLLCFDVDGDAGRREEVVKLPMATAKVGVPAIREREVRVLDDIRVPVRGNHGDCGAWGMGVCERRLELD
mmetsp:Transcript_20181/g.65025  ORF Transcript_20181/g.65025 Transcript_20181/m.65025 type:complete len:201 (+) Transcript_20181:702-1304(+)